MASHHEIAALWNAPYEGTTYWVLYRLCARAESDHHHCWPLIRTIAKEARVSEKTAHRAISRLRADGVLTVEPDPGHSNIWTLHIPESWYVKPAWAESPKSDLKRKRTHKPSEKPAKHSRSKTSHVHTASPPLALPAAAGGQSNPLAAARRPEPSDSERAEIARLDMEIQQILRSRSRAGTSAAGGRNGTDPDPTTP